MKILNRIIIIVSTSILAVSCVNQTTVSDSIMVDPQLISFLGKETVNIISTPDKVDAYLINENSDGYLTVGEYSIDGDAFVTLSKRSALTLQWIVLDIHNLRNNREYLYSEESIAKKNEFVSMCSFSPDVGFRFYKGSQFVDVLFSSFCRGVGYYISDKSKFDFVPDDTSQQIKRITEGLFPRE